MIDDKQDNWPYRDIGYVVQFAVSRRIDRDGTMRDGDGVEWKQEGERKNDGRHK